MFIGHFRSLVNIVLALDQGLPVSTRRPAKVIPSGFLNQPTTKSIYQDCPEVIVEGHHPDGVSKASQLLLRRLMRRSTVTSSQHPDNTQALNGLFTKLLDPVEFQRILYPGMSRATRQRTRVPASFQQLLHHPVYFKALEQRMTAVQAKAESVLDNVKRRGAKEGDVMDSATETALRPQILNEAFGREVVTVVHRIHAELTAALSRDTRSLASQDADCAWWQQLNPSMGIKLLDPAVGYAVQDDFLGAAWLPLICEDLARFDTAEHLSHYGNLDVLHHPCACTDGRIAYVEPEECHHRFPALAECLGKLHALPFELNRTHPQECHLSVPLKHSSLITSMDPGDAQSRRMDGGTTAQGDNGHAITCIYFASGELDGFDGSDGSEVGTGGSLVLEREDGSIAKVSPRPDRLVLFNSRQMINSRTPLLKRRDEGPPRSYTLTFWIHGKPLASE